MPVWFWRVVSVSVLWRCCTPQWSGSRPIVPLLWGLCSEVSNAISCCMTCTLEQNEGDSLILPCCRSRLHFSCFVQCVKHWVRDDVFRECGLSMDLCVPPSNSTANSMPQSARMPAEPNIRPLYCNRVNGPPDFSPLEDRRMESPIHPNLARMSGRCCGYAGVSPATLLWMTCLLWSLASASLAP